MITNNFSQAFAAIVVPNNKTVVLDFVRPLPGVVICLLYVVYASVNKTIPIVHLHRNHSPKPSSI